MPLTYACGDLDLNAGDIVSVPLGPRTVLAFVLCAPAFIEAAQPLRSVLARADAPRAFTETGLALARFIADRYLSTLGEALNCVVLSSAVPRMIDSFVPAHARPDPGRFPSVPPRLVALIWDEFPAGFRLETLLRHPEARRAADRADLLRAIGALVRARALRRERRFVAPRTHEYRIKVLKPGSREVTGPRAQALVAFVRARGEVAPLGGIVADVALQRDRQRPGARIVHERVRQNELVPRRQKAEERRDRESQARQRQRDAPERVEAGAAVEEHGLFELARRVPLVLLGPLGGPLGDGPAVAKEGA